MRKIIVTEFMTLDGVVEAPGGNETLHPHAGWQPKYRDPETGKYKVDELASVDTRIFDDNRQLKKFTLKHARAVDNGVLILEYQPTP